MRAHILSSSTFAERYVAQESLERESLLQIVTLMHQSVFTLPCALIPRNIVPEDAALFQKVMKANYKAHGPLLHVLITAHVRSTLAYLVTAPKRDDKLA